jgi:hypothetical protein
MNALICDITVDGKTTMTHKDTSTALSSGAFATETLDLAVGVDFVILQDGHLDLLALVLDLLGGLRIQIKSSIYVGRRCAE